MRCNSGCIEWLSNVTCHHQNCMTCSPGCMNWPANITCHHQTCMRCNPDGMKRPSTLTCHHQKLHDMQSSLHKMAFPHNMSSSQIA
eukprot:2216807-Karenia_brevis.AAC.1